jgi:serine/threonine-protein kinase
MVMDNSARKAGMPQDQLDPMKSGTMATHKVIEAPFLKGEKIAGRYVVDRVLAEGGMGIVLAARHLELDEMVAIKFLKPEFARQQDIIGRFAREAKAAARIKSEYIATVLDVGVINDRGPYIVMEYLEGEDLETVLATEGKLPVERSIELVLQACEALAAAHANGIIHRDIKPENLFLVKREKGLPIIKVLDFGVSKTALTGNMFGGAIDVAKTQSLLGSPLYMSPEQLRGKIDVDYTADIWSMGAMLYELLTGRAPFEGSSITEVCASVLETVPKEIPTLVPDVPSELALVVMKCLEKEPTRRYQSIAELAVALAPFGPKRARMCVERAIAVSKSAGLLASGFENPNSVPPPPMSLRDEQAAEAAAQARAARNGEQDDDQDDAPQAASPAKRALVLAALFALGAGGMLAAKTMLSKPAETPVATTPTVAAQPAAAQPPAAAVITAQPTPAAVAPVQPPGQPAVVETTPNRAGAGLPNAAVGGRNPARPGFAAAPGAGGGALRAAANTGAASAAQPAAVTAPPPVTAAPATTPSPTTNPTRSAIDDRK